MKSVKYLCKIMGYISKSIEKGLCVIPGYQDRRDNHLKFCLDKLTSNEKLDIRDEFKVGFQAIGSKVGYLGGAAISFHLFYKAGVVQGAIATGFFGTFFLLNQISNGLKLTKIIREHMPDEEKNLLRQDLEDKNIPAVRKRLESYVW